MVAQGLIGPQHPAPEEAPEESRDRGRGPDEAGVARALDARAAAAQAAAGGGGAASAPWARHALDACRELPSRVRGAPNEDPSGLPWV